MRAKSDLSDPAAAVTEQHPIMFCRNLLKAHDELTARGAMLGPVITEDLGDLGCTGYFEIRDCEGNVFEVCKDT